MRILSAFILAFGVLFSTSYAQEPVPNVPSVIDRVTPNVFNVKITLESGEVIEIKKVAATRHSLERKLTVRMFFGQDIRIVHEGKVRHIEAKDIKVMEFTKVKDLPKPEPTPVPAKR